MGEDTIWIIASVVCFMVWSYSIKQFGLLKGITFGLIPSLIAGAIVLGVLSFIMK